MTANELLFKLHSFDSLTRYFQTYSPLIRVFWRCKVLLPQDQVDLARFQRIRPCKNLVYHNPVAMVDNPAVMVDNRAVMVNNPAVMVHNPALVVYNPLIIAVELIFSAPKLQLLSRTPTGGSWEKHMGVSERGKLVWRFDNFNRITRKFKRGNIIK